MSILKASAWSSTGTRGERKVAWGSSSGKVEQDSVSFRGKLILITNSIPQSRETKAFLSRSIFYEMNFGKSEIISMLRDAAKSSEYFEDNRVAGEVAEFLIEKLKERDHSNISLRTLHVGCELAATHPDDWRELLEPLLPPLDPESVMESFATELSPKDQEQHFISATGMSRRTFYNVKKELGLTVLTDAKLQSVGESHRNEPTILPTKTAFFDRLSNSHWEVPISDDHMSDGQMVGIKIQSQVIIGTLNQENVITRVADEELTFCSSSRIGRF